MFCLRFTAVVVALLTSSLSFAMCDLEHFRWPCDFPAQLKPSHATPSIVYCGGATFYVSRASYDQLLRNNYDAIHMVMNINDAYFESPCIPGDKEPN